MTKRHSIFLATILALSISGLSAEPIQGEFDKVESGIFKDENEITYSQMETMWFYMKKFPISFNFRQWSRMFERAGRMNQVEDQLEFKNRMLDFYFRPQDGGSYYVLGKNQIERLISAEFVPLFRTPMVPDRIKKSHLMAIQKPEIYSATLLSILNETQVGITSGDMQSILDYIESDEASNLFKSEDPAESVKLASMKSELVAYILSLIHNGMTNDQNSHRDRVLKFLEMIFGNMQSFASIEATFQNGGHATFKFVGIRKMQEVAARVKKLTLYYDFESMPLEYEFNP